MNKVLFAILLIAISSFAVHAAPLRQIDESNSIPNQYIVVFGMNVTSAERDIHLETLFLNFVAEKDFDNKFLHSFDINWFRGFSAVLSPRMLELQRSSPYVAYIEQDAVITAFQSCTVQDTNVPWGLDRISEEVLNLDGNYVYPNTGENVDVYVVDTGINIAHEEFEGRAVWGINYVDDNNNDCNGHGTHVAGTIGSKTYGVAKKVTLTAVKVLNCAGSGSYEGVVAGVNWVTQQYSKRMRPSTANLSLGGPISETLDEAITASIEAGVVFVVAAGNSNDNACNYSPANVPSAISVGATSVADRQGVEEDVRSSFSNYGECVTVFAPGSLIESTWIGDKNTEKKTISGTSMASPHVCGVVAEYLDAHPSATPAQVRTWLVSQAVQSDIDLACKGAYFPDSCNQSPNLLANLPCEI